MSQKSKWSYLYYGATVLLIGSIVLSVVLGSPEWMAKYPLLRQVIHSAAWPVWFAALVLMLVPMFDLRRDKNASGNGWGDSGGGLVESGAYSIVRHPQYVGWSLIYPALFLFNPQWLVAITGAAGIALVVLLARQEEESLLKQFGQAYERYMEAVPGMNLLAGARQQHRREMQDDEV